MSDLLITRRLIRPMVWAEAACFARRPQPWVILMLVIHVQLVERRQIAVFDRPRESLNGLYANGR